MVEKTENALRRAEENIDIDTNCVLERTAQLITHFARGLEEAEAILAKGEPLEADRRAKALISLIKASRALEDWTMDKLQADDPAASGGEPSYDPKAELERRLLDYEKRERKAELARQAERSRRRTSSVELENMGVLSATVCDLHRRRLAPIGTGASSCALVGR